VAASGAVFGAGFGLAAARYVNVLLYEVKPSETGVFVAALLAVLAITVVAAIVPVVRSKNRSDDRLEGGLSRFLFSPRAVSFSACACPRQLS
jgi:hypothetical protein